MTTVEQLRDAIQLLDSMDDIAHTRALLKMEAQTGRSYRHWDRDEIYHEEDRFDVSVKRYACCGDYDYETTAVTFDELLMSDAEFGEHVVGLTHARIREQEELKRAEEERKEKERLARQEAKEKRDREEFERLRKKFQS